MSGNLGLAMLADSDVTDTGIPGYVFNFEYNLGYFVGAAIGQNIGNMRAEAEIGLQNNTIDSVSVNGSASSSVYGDQDIRLITVLFNFYYDFKTGSAFTPYLSGGLGLGNMKLDGTSKDDAVWAIQIGAGVAYMISENVMLDLRYRHLQSSDGEFDTTKVEYTSDNAIFSVRYYF